VSDLDYSKPLTVTVDLPENMTSRERANIMQQAQQAMIEIIFKEFVQHERREPTALEKAGFANNGDLSENKKPLNGTYTLTFDLHKRFRDLELLQKENNGKVDYTERLKLVQPEENNPHRL
jgi:hypothetical protein